MAILDVSGNNASYTLTLSGMSTSTRYHVFIADLSSSGSVTGYKCLRSSLGSSSKWTYIGSSNSPYSNYGRSVYVYTSTAATIHSVGTIYTFEEMRSGCTFMDSNTIPAATEYTYYGRLTLNANGGSFYGTGYTSISWPTGGAVSGTGVGGALVSITLPVAGGNYVPYRDGYTFSGWNTKSDGTGTTYESGKSVSFTAKSTSSSNPTTVSLWAVWEEPYSGSISVNSYTYDSNDKSFQGTLSVTVTLSPASGSWTLKATHSRTSTSVSKTMTPSGSTTLSTTLVLPYLYMSSEQTYTVTLTAPDGTVVDEIVVPCLDVPTYTLTFNANGGTGAPSKLTTYGNVAKVTIPNTIPTRAKYKFLGWALGALSTVLEVAVDDLPCEYSFTYSKTLYAVWEAIDTIELFTWTGKDTTDASMIKKGEPVKDVITAEKWNELLSKIKALNDGYNLTFDYTLVSKGSDITHTQFNNARLGLTKIKVALNTTTVIPDEQQKGYIMYASLFNGGGSIKGALNGLIGAYNNA